MDQQRGLSSEVVAIGVARGRGLSPEKVSWERYEPHRWFAPYTVIGIADAAVVTLKLTPSSVEVYSPFGGTTYFDATTVSVKFSPSGVDVGPAPPVTPPPTPVPSQPPVIPGPFVTKWTLVHYTHDDMALGEVYPNSNDFAIYLNRVGYCNYDIDGSHDLARKEHTSPYETDFVLFRGKDPIMGGEHTGITLNPIESGGITVAGQDWGHWLERQQWPFDPDNPLDNTYLVTGRDIALVFGDLLTVITSFPNSLPIDLSAIVTVGNLIDYKIDVNDSEDMYSKLTTLAKRAPGFDFEITWDKRAILYYPQKGSSSTVALVQGHNIYNVEYTNNGPIATHTLGTARGSSSQVGYVVESNAPQYRRAMTNSDFGDITDISQLAAQTQSEALRNVTPHKEITLTVVKDNLDIWSEVSLGDSVLVDVNTSYEHIEGQWRVVGMQCSPNDEGDEEWKLTIDDGTLSL